MQGESRENLLEVLAVVMIASPISSVFGYWGFSEIRIQVGEDP